MRSSENRVQFFYFLQDLEYWNVDELYLEQCCVQKYYQQRELLTWDMGTTKKEDELEIFRAGRLGRLQKILWDLFERPHTSIGARVMIYYYLVVSILKSGTKCYLYLNSSTHYLFTIMNHQRISTF